MASLINDPDGRKRIQFFDGNGVRQTIRMGRMDKKTATAAKVRIEALAAAQKVRHVPDGETARWAASLDDAMHGKLAAAGLVLSRDSLILGRWLAAHAARAQLKPDSRRKLLDTAGKLNAFFGADANVRAVTPDGAARWREHLAKTLGTASVRTHTGNAKGFFSPLVERKIIEDNPFAALSSGPTASKNDRYVTPFEAQQILDACPDWRYRTTFALARLAGLRIRSEGFGLLWRDVNFETGRIYVRSPKTERFKGHEARVVPMFPALRRVLEEALHNAADGAEQVIPMRWTGGVPERMLAVVKTTPVKPWPALFQTLRSSCEKEWAMHYPQYVVSKWIGHSIVISGRHYVNDVPEEMYAAAQNAAQQGAEMSGSMGQVSSGDGGVAAQNEHDFRSIPIGAGQHGMGDEGLEPLPESENTRTKPQAADSEAQNPAHLKICPLCGYAPPPARRAGAAGRGGG